MQLVTGGYRNMGRGAITRRQPEGKRGNTSRTRSVVRTRDDAALMISAARARHRFSQKRSRPRRRANWRRAINAVGMGSAAMALSGMLLACMSGLYRVIETSRMFGLEAVEIMGNSRVSSQEIIEHAGITAGVNILTLNNEEVARRIEAIPWVGHVSIIKRFPHELTIKVTEREPSAVVVIDGTLWYVDKGGTVFHRIGPEDRRDYPLVTGFSKEMVTSAQGRPSDEIVHTLALLEMAQHYPGMPSISEITFDTVKGWSIYMQDFPVPVYLGAGDLEQKIIHLARIYPVLSRHSPSPERIDLSFPCQAVLRQPSGAKEVAPSLKAVADKGHSRVSEPAT